MSKTLHSLVVFTAVLLIANIAYAAGNADWVQPATDLIESLESGLVKIGTVVVGVGVIIVGLVACITNQMNWDKFGYVLMGGILIMTGPAAVRALLSVSGQ
jgi:type IV secretion system protein VirB2